MIHTATRTHALSLLALAAVACSLPAAPDDTPVDAGTSAGTDAGSPPAGELTLLDVERTVELTPDGTRALLWNQSTGDLFFYDVASGRLEKKTSLDKTELQSQMPLALSPTGRIAAIYGVKPEHAGLWDETNGWVKLGSPLAGCVDNEATPPVVMQYGSAFDLSADGHVAVGLLWADCAHVRAFLWSDASGTGKFTLLNQLGSETGNNRATAVSADGKSIAGFASNGNIDRTPALWSADGEGLLLDPKNDTEPGEAKLISADGKIVVGDWAREAGGIGGFVWTRAGGVERFSTSTPDRDTLISNAMTADGKYVFGKYQSKEDVGGLLETTYDGAFVWSKATGVRKLQDVVVAAGVTVPAGVTIDNVMSVSADGRVILGSVAKAAPPGDPLGFPTYQSFVLRLAANVLP